MPSPSPIRRQLLRSLGVPCKSRGYHAKGTETARPSLRSTIRASSVTVTCRAVANRISIAEEFIPSPQEIFSIFLYKPLYLVDLTLAKPFAILKSNGVKPKFTFVPFALNVDVRRFISVARIKEESVRARNQDSWHVSPLLCGAAHFRCASRNNCVRNPTGKRFSRDPIFLAIAGIYPAPK